MSGLTLGEWRTKILSWVGAGTLAVSFGFEVLRFRLLQKYYSMPGRFKTSKPQK